MPQPETRLRCAENGAEADENAEGWRVYRADLPNEGRPELVAYCAECAAREFDDGV
jgi:hypothetical protein